jgi:hypothetical protein
VLRDMLQEVGTGAGAETAAANGIKNMQQYVDK